MATHLFIERGRTFLLQSFYCMLSRMIEGRTVRRSLVQFGSYVVNNQERKQTDEEIGASPARAAHRTLARTLAHGPEGARVEVRVRRYVSSWLVVELSNVNSRS